MRSIIVGISALLIAGFFTSCASHKDKINRVGKRNSKTGIKYGEDTYEPVKFKESESAPGLVLIPGGTFMMGGGEKDIEMMKNNRQRQVTVQSFYLDETEISNIDWKVFIKQMDNTSGDGGLKKDELLPDTNVWRRDLAFNDPYAETYYSHPAFDMYPIVGVNWHQANEYCKWRTKVVNEAILEDDEEATTYPSYRLPTEAEWEYAARGLQESEVYSWEGKSLRNRKGQFRANFKPGRGDYAGWRGGDGHHMTDGYMITAPVGEFWPNDFGLYNMSGNVAEWTQDTYRLLSLEDVDDFNPFRRKGKTEIRPDDWLDDVTYKAKESLLYNPDELSSDDADPFDNVKVYRGGSWNDIAYYLSPGVRRYFPADSSHATIGFRCAMIRVGSPD
ncbi:MAG: SUMF1/EgtB/PvdO family nonheme iron enzyme [Bacteroidota bacterium]